MQLWRYAVAQDYAKDGLGDLSNFALHVRQFPQWLEAAEGALSDDPSAKDTLKVWHMATVRLAAAIASGIGGSPEHQRGPGTRLVAAESGPLADIGQVGALRCSISIRWRLRLDIFVALREVAE